MASLSTILRMKSPIDSQVPSIEPRKSVLRGLDLVTITGCIAPKNLSQQLEKSRYTQNNLRELCCNKLVTPQRHWTTTHSSTSFTASTKRYDLLKTNPSTCLLQAARYRSCDIVVRLVSLLAQSSFSLLHLVVYWSSYQISVCASKILCHWT